MITTSSQLFCNYKAHAERADVSSRPTATGPSAAEAGKGMLNKRVSMLLLANSPAQAISKKNST